MPYKLYDSPSPNDWFASFQQDMMKLNQRRRAAGEAEYGGSWKKSADQSAVEDFFRFTVDRGAESLTLDLRPGPMTAWGQSIEMVSPSGWSRVIGPEIHVPQDAAEAPVLRTPMENLMAYMEAGLTAKPFKGESRRAVFNRVLNQGTQNLGGGVLQYGPHHPATARQEFASRVMVNLAPGIKDVNSAYGRILNMMKSAFEPNDPWSYLRGYAPWTEEDDIVRLRQFSTGIRMEGASGMEWNVMGIGADRDKLIKQANIAWGGGLREEAATYYQGDNVVRQVQAGSAPQNLAEMQGLRKLDLLFPGQQEARDVWMQRNVYTMAASPFSGSLVTYDKPIAGLTAAYRSQHRTPVKVETMADLANARYRSGVFERVDINNASIQTLREAGIGRARAEAIVNYRAEQGPISDLTSLSAIKGVGQKTIEKLQNMTQWQKVRDLEGFRLEAGERATIGLWEYGRGANRTTQPITMSAEGKALIFDQGPAQLLMSKGMFRDLGTPSAGAFAGDPSSAYLELADESSPRYARSFMEKIRSSFPGQVRPVLGDEFPEIMQPFSQETGASLKGGGIKVTPQQAAFIGQVLQPTVNIGATQAEISGFHGELKNPLIQFAMQFGALPREKKIGMMGDVFSPKVAKALGGYIRGLGENETVSMMELGATYSRATGTPTDPYEFMNKLHQGFGKIMTDRPEYTYGRYGMAFQPEGQWIPVGAVSADERKAYSQEFMRGLQLAAADEKSPFYGISRKEQAQLYRDRMRFTKAGKDSYMWEVNQPGLIGTLVAPVVPEFMSKQVSVTYEEMAALSFNQPGAAEKLGLLPGQSPDATGYRPKHVRAWEQLGNIFRYTDDPKAPVLPKQLRQTVSQEQLDKLQQRLLTMPGQASVDELDQLLQDVGLRGDKPLFNPNTGKAIPTARSVRDISEFQYYGADAEPVSRMAKIYRDLLYEFSMNVGGGPQNIADLPYDQTRLKSDAEYRRLAQEQRTTYAEKQIADVAGGSKEKYERMLASGKLTSDPFHEEQTGIRLWEQLKNQDILELQYETAQGTKSGGLGGQAMGEFNRLLSNIAGKKGGALYKNLMRRFVRGAQGGRYSITTGLGANEMLISEEQMMRGLKGMGMTAMARGEGDWSGTDIDKWTKMAYEQVKKMGGMPTAWWRSPTLTREGGVPISTAVTPEIVKQMRGIDVNPPKGFAAAIGTAALPVFGDWDADPIARLLLGNATPSGINFQGYEEAVLQAKAEYGEWRSRVDTSMAKAMGTTAGVPGGELNVLAKSFSEMADPQTEKLLRSGLIDIAPEDVFGGGQQRMVSRFGMGKAYNMRRGLEAAAGTLKSFTQAGIAELQTSGALGYQQYLDYIQTDFRNVEKFIGSLHMQLDNSGNVTMKGLTGPGQWTAVGGSKGTARAGEQKLEEALATMLIDDKVRPEYGIGMLSTSEKMMGETIEKLKPGGGNFAEVLRGMIRGEGYDVGESPLGFFSYMSLAGRMTGQTRAGGVPFQAYDYSTKEMYNVLERITGSAADRPITFRGKTMKISELMQDEDIQRGISSYKTLIGENLTASELAEISDEDTALGQFIISQGGSVARQAIELEKIKKKSEALIGKDATITQGGRSGRYFAAPGGVERVEGGAVAMPMPPEPTVPPRRATSDSPASRGPSGYRPYDELVAELDNQPGAQGWSYSDRVTYRQMVKDMHPDREKFYKEADRRAKMSPSEKELDARWSNLVGDVKPGSISHGAAKRNIQEARKILATQSGYMEEFVDVSMRELQRLGATSDDYNEAMLQVNEKDPSALRGFIERFAPQAKRIKGIMPTLLKAIRSGKAQPGVFDELSSMDQSTLINTQDPSTPIGKAMLAAQEVAGLGRSMEVGKGAFQYVSPGEAKDAIDKFTKSVDKATETVAKYGDTHEKSRKAVEEMKQARTEMKFTVAGAQRSLAEKMLDEYPEDPTEQDRWMGKAAKGAEAQATALSQMVSGGGGATIGEGMRRLLGGWNLFYMQRLAGLGLEQMQKGYQEYEQYATAGEAQRIRALGAGQVEPRRNVEMEYERAMLRSGGGGYRGIRALQAQTAGTLGNEVMGIGLTGIGFSTLANFAGPGIGTVGEALGGRIGGKIQSFGTNLADPTKGTAGNVGMLAMLGAFGMQQYSYAMDMEDTLSRASALEASGKTWTSSYQLLGPSIRSWWEGDGFFRPSEIVGQRAERIKAFAGGAVPTGENYGRMTPKELQRFAYEVGMSDIPQLAHLSAETQRQIIPALTGAGYGIDQIDLLGTALQAGTPVMEMAQLNNLLVGGAPMTQGETTLAALPLAGLPGRQITRRTSALGAMAQMPGMTRYLQQLQAQGDMANTGRGTDWWRDAVAGMMEQVVDGPNQGMLNQRWAAQEGLRAIGLDAGPTEFWRYNRDTYFTEQMRWDEAQGNVMLARRQNLASRAMGLGVGLNAMVGLDEFAQLGTGQMGFAEGLMNMSPIRMTQAMQIGGMGNMNLPMGLTALDLANTDVSLSGELTGLNWGTTSLARGNVSSQAMGNMILTNTGTQAAQAAISGINFRTGQLAQPGEKGPDIVAGTRGLQWLSRWQSIEAQEDQMGIRAAQIALQREFQPQFWAIQDRQRALSNRQAQWGFQYQEQQFEMQGRQFYENQALQRSTQLMQRSWTQQDWGHQDMMRNMQWGWTQEDFQENVRFMSGRQRRLAERQMERQTTVHGIEGDRIETQRQRQKSMWQAEDERYETTLKHFREQRDLLEVNMKKQKEFYEEGKELQEEMIKLQREYWERNMQLQEASLDIQQKQIEKNKEIMLAQAEIGQWQDDYNAKWAIARDYANEVLEKLIEALDPEKLRELFSESGVAQQQQNDWHYEGFGDVPNQDFSDITVQVNIGNEQLGGFVTNILGEKLRVGR